jgi:hypothetical protein
MCSRHGVVGEIAMLGPMPGGRGGCWLQPRGCNRTTKLGYALSRPLLFLPTEKKNYENKRYMES